MIVPGDEWGHLGKKLENAVLLLAGNCTAAASSIRPNSPR
jgi:hypothetical protein